MAIVKQLMDMETIVTSHAANHHQPPPPPFYHGSPHDFSSNNHQLPRRGRGAGRILVLIVLHALGGTKGTGAWNQKKTYGKTHGKTHGKTLGKWWFHGIFHRKMMVSWDCVEFYGWIIWENHGGTYLAIFNCGRHSYDEIIKKQSAFHSY